MDTEHLDHMAGCLKRIGVQRVMFCIGHLAHKVQECSASAPLSGLIVETSIEPSLLGAAGGAFAAPPHNCARTRC